MRRKKQFCHYNTHGRGCVVYTNKAVRGGWKTTHESQKNPLTYPPYQKADNIKLMLKELQMMPLGILGILIEILVIFLKRRKKHSKIIRIKI